MSRADLSGGSRHLVGAVVCASGGPETVRGCLSSLRSQTFRDFVVRVVFARPQVAHPSGADWRAPGGAEAAIKKRYESEFPEAEFSPCPRRHGFAAAVNDGIRAGAEEFVATLAGHVRPEPTWLEDLVARALGARPGSPGSAGGDQADETFWASAVLLADRPDRLQSAGVSIRPGGGPVLLCAGEPAWSLPRGAVEVLGPCACAALYRRRMLDQIGLFDERFLPCESDVDLALRARLAGHRCVLVSTSRARAGRSEESGRATGSSTYLGHRNTVLYLVKSMPASWLLRRLPALAFSGARALLKTPWRREGWALIAAKFGAIWRLPRAALERICIRARARRQDGGEDGRRPDAEIASLVVPFVAGEPDGEGFRAGVGPPARPGRVNDVVRTTRPGRVNDVVRTTRPGRVDHVVRTTRPGRVDHVVRTTRPVWPTTEESEELELARAEEKTEKYRKTDAVVRVLDARGNPLPGVLVEVEQTGHEFLFGSGIAFFDRLDSTEANDVCKRRFRELFTYATVDLSWRFYEPVRGEPAHERTDRIVAWCAEHGIRLGGRGLLSGTKTGIPRWSQGLLTRDAQRERVFEIMRRYAGEIEFWEVVTEPFHFVEDNVRCAALDEAHQWAREADGAARLVVSSRGPLGFFDACEDVRRLLGETAARGVPFDVVGVAAHLPETNRFPLDHVRWALDTFAELGKDIHVVGFMPLASGRAITGSHRRGVWDEGAQAEYAEKFYRLCFAHPAVRAVVWQELGPLSEPGGGLFRRDSRPRPVHAVLKRLIKEEWHTRARGLTDASGCFVFRAFHGGHSVRVDAPGGPVQRRFRLVEGGSNRFTVRLGRPVGRERAGQSPRATGGRFSGR